MTEIPDINEIFNKIKVELKLAKKFFNERDYYESRQKLSSAKEQITLIEQVMNYYDP